MGRFWTGNTRAPWHDYTSRQIYHITLCKRSEVIPFGSLTGDWRLKPGTPGSPYVKLSDLGKAIKDCLWNISSVHPSLRVYQYTIMPDHVHFILSVENTLDEILGRKLAIFKVMVNKRAGIESVFAKGFNDQLLTTSRNLQTRFDYIRENPYRLAVRRAKPDFFTRRDNMVIGGHQCQVYGNVHLLGNPFKEQVIVHRADTAEALARHKDEWLYTAANGGVLVSPFISKKEKEIRAEAEVLGARIILVTHEAFPERYKPAARDFTLCTEGRMLIISLGLPADTPLSRPLCLQMNSVSSTIASL